MFWVELIAKLIGWTIGIIIAIVMLIIQGIFALFRAGAAAQQKREQEERQAQYEREAAERQAQAQREAAERERQYREQQRRQEEERQRAVRMRESDRTRRESLTKDAQQGKLLLLKRELDLPVQWTDSAEELASFAGNITGVVMFKQDEAPPSQVEIPLVVEQQDLNVRLNVADNGEGRQGDDLPFESARLNSSDALTVLAGNPQASLVYHLKFAVGKSLGNEFEFGKYVTRYEMKSIPSLVSREYIQGLTVKADLLFPLLVK